MSPYRLIVRGLAASLLFSTLIGCYGKNMSTRHQQKLAEYSASMPSMPSMQSMEPASLEPPTVEFNTETYDHLVDNSFLDVLSNPLSTFSIDVDTASYSNVRRFLNNGELPPKGAVRIEEMVNYFDYDYRPPTDGHPFSTAVEVATCPWNPRHRLARIALKGKEFPSQERPTINLVFLIDVSGSMYSANKLPLLKTAMKMLVGQLDDKDHIAIVTYAGSSGLKLPSTPCSDRQKIIDALDTLQAGGSTAGGEGIRLAYQTAENHFVAGQVNRVILCTDGDFNVGVTNQSDLVDLIEQKAKSGVFLTVLGFGMGNYKDSTLEKLADKGNGNYGYVDTIREARKLLVEQMTGSLITIAKDVKIQVEFNPAQVGAYRLIGYENRLLRNEDFNDDTKDAGEIGAGHTVTALYELVPPGLTPPGASNVDPLKYQQPGSMSPGATSGDLLTLKLRYKEPEGNESRLLEFPIVDPGPVRQYSTDYCFALSVAAFGMILRDSPYKGDASIPMVLELAEHGRGSDRNGYRSEFIQLVKLAEDYLPSQNTAVPQTKTAYEKSWSRRRQSPGCPAKKAF